MREKPARSSKARGRDAVRRYAGAHARASVQDALRGGRAGRRAYDGGRELWWDSWMTRRRDRRARRPRGGRMLDEDERPLHRPRALADARRRGAVVIEETWPSS